MSNPAVVCHEKFYQKYLPQLFRAAVYLLGDRGMAETVTEQVWLDACVKGSQDGEATFSRRSTRILLRCCAGVHCDYRPEEVSKTVRVPDRMLVQSLGDQLFADRCLTVLRLVLGKDIPEVAAILWQPQWMVTRRLEKLSTKFHGMADEREQRSFC